MEGWISLHRKIRKNPIFNDMELLRLWLICLTEATHRPYEQIVGRQTVHLEAGQFVTGRFDLHQMYNTGLGSEQQKSPYTVWRWLETLQRGDFLSITSSNKFSIVSILNWEKYQNSEQQIEQQVSNKRATNEQQVSTNNNSNKSSLNNKKILKDIYAEKVTLTKDEYDKLITKYGTEDLAKAAIAKLSNYKCSTGKKYKSDYHTLIGWVFEDFEKRKLFVLNGGQKDETYRRGNQYGRNQASGYGPSITDDELDELQLSTDFVPMREMPGHRDH